MTMQHILPAVLAAVFALSAVPAQAEMKNQWVDYSHGDTKLKAYMAYDDKIPGRRPAVLVAHARSGMSPQTLKLTEIWAKLGYVSFAADIFGYGQGVLPKNVEEMTAQTTIYSKDRELLKARMKTGYDALLKSPMVDPAKVALIGYCFGGMVGVEFGSTGVPLVANVSIHGSFRDHAPGMGEERQRHVPDPARRRGRGLSALGGRQSNSGTARGEGPLSIRGLQRHRARLLRPEEQGRGACQRAVDRLDRANAQGAFRHLRAQRGFEAAHYIRNRFSFFGELQMNEENG